MSDFELDNIPVAALADCPKYPDVRYGFVALTKRVENRLDIQFEHHNIEDLSDVVFVFQPFSGTKVLPTEYVLTPIE